MARRHATDEIRSQLLRCRRWSRGSQRSDDVRRGSGARIHYTLQVEGQLATVAQRRRRREVCNMIFIGKAKNGWNFGNVNIISL